MAGTTSYKNQWQAENKERINLVVPKGYKEKVRTAADRAGMSLNGYIKAAIDRQMEQGVEQFLKLTFQMNMER